MADVAWMELRIWPWHDDYPEIDEELRTAFRDLDLLDGYAGLQGAMNGFVEVEHLKSEVARVTVSGEMTGGSWQIQESGLLEILKERNLAFFLKGDAKYEWDGDETWWHPGREEIFRSAAGESGRFLSEHDFAVLSERCLPVAERIALIDARIAACRSVTEKYVAEERDRAASGEPPKYENLVTWNNDVIANHLLAQAALLADNPEQADLGVLVSEWFSHKPLDWRPDASWVPALVRDSVEES